MKTLSMRLAETRRSFKPRDVEEPIDFYWHRPLAGLCVQLLVPTPITANQVTVASGFLGLLAGVAIAFGGFGDRRFAALGGFLLFLSILADCADGQLARIRGASSPIGRILDGAMDIVAPTATLTGMVLYLLFAAGFSHAIVWPLGVVTALSLIWHCSEYDVSKNIFLHANHPDFCLGGSTLPTLENINAMETAFLAEGAHHKVRLVRLWRFWTAPQIKTMSPWLRPERHPQNESERTLYLALFRGPMRVLAWCGFGTHLFVLTLAAYAAPYWPPAIFVAWAIIVVPMNAACAWVVGTRQARERLFVANLRDLRKQSAETA